MHEEPLKPSLTLLTDPMAIGRFWMKETAKRVARQLRDLAMPSKSDHRRSRYRGHFAVTRSLVEGLQKIRVNATYNPTRLSDVADVVVVLSGIDSVRQAILWKRQGRTKRLLAGPNILVFPSAHPHVIAAPEVDCCITPAEWVCRAYEDDCPALKGRCASWPAGVDTGRWYPDLQKRNPKQALIFDKLVKGSVGPISTYATILERRGYIVSIVTYGSYTAAEYLDKLQRSSLMVGFATGESQGIAWTEAWSTDVPTLLWFQDRDTIQGHTIATSTAPYLSDDTGLFFDSTTEFEMALTRWEKMKEAFHPRQWVLSNMTDEVCARQLCRLAGVQVPA